MKRRFAISAACLIGLSGCGVHVQDSDNAEGWAYREGSALQLVIRSNTSRRLPVAGLAPTVGEWTGEGRFVQPPLYARRFYELEIRDDQVAGVSRRTHVGSLDEIAGLPSESAEYDERHLVLRLKRDAGILVLDGEKEGASATGNVRFEANADFNALVEALAGRPVEPTEMASLTFANVRRSDVEALRSTTQRLSPAELIALRDRGITGESVRDLSTAGQRFSIEEIVQLRDAGIKGEYVRDLQAAGLAPTVDELLRLKRNGVSTGFVAGLRGPEGDLPPIADIIRLRNSGVSADYISELRAAGYDLSTADVIRLSRTSVGAGYASGVRAAGYNLSVDALIRLRNSNVSVQYIQDMHQPGYERLTIDQLIDAREKGLSADFVRNLRIRERAPSAP